MKVLAFQAQLSPDHTLAVPANVAQEIQAEQSVHVVLLLPEEENGGDQSWASLSAEQFLAGYSDSDAIYDQLPAR
jgi:hypothetical protein